MRGGLEARGDVFLPFEAGFAQVHVAVGKAGQEHQALGVLDGFVPGGRDPAGWRHGDDLAVFDVQVDVASQVPGVGEAEFHYVTPEGCSLQ